MYKIRLFVGKKETELSEITFPVLIDERAPHGAQPSVDTSALARRSDLSWPVLIDPTLDPGTLELRYGSKVVGRHRSWCSGGPDEPTEH